MTQRRRDGGAEEDRAAVTLTYAIRLLDEMDERVGLQVFLFPFVSL